MITPLKTLYYIESTYSANINRITILITLLHCTLNASARHCLNQVCCSTHASELPVAKKCTSCFFGTFFALVS